jgi:hypothetical protein
VRFTELEAKMVAMSAITNSGGPKPHDTPSFHASGGSIFNDEDFERFILSGMAITAADLTLEAFAYTRSQMAASKEAPRGASPSLDPQRGEGNKQARLPVIYFGRCGTNFFHGSSYQGESSLSKYCTRRCRIGRGSKSGE